MTEKNRLNKRFDLSRLSENSRMLLRRALEIPSEEYEHRRGDHTDELSVKLDDSKLIFVKSRDHYTLYLFERGGLKTKTFYNENNLVRKVYEGILSEKGSSKEI